MQADPPGLSRAPGRLAHALKLPIAELRPPTVIMMVADIFLPNIGSVAAPAAARRRTDSSGRNLGAVVIARVRGGWVGPQDRCAHSQAREQHPRHVLPARGGRSQDGAHALYQPLVPLGEGSPHIMTDLGSPSAL